MSGVVGVSARIEDSVRAVDNGKGGNEATTRVVQGQGPSKMRLFGSTATTTPLVLRRVDGASAALERTISSSTTFSASPYSPGLAALSHILCRPITACPRKHHVVRHNYTDPQLRCAVAIPAATLFEKSVREHALSSSIPPPDWPCMKPRRLQHQLPIPGNW